MMLESNENNYENNFLISPNPTWDFITIQLKNSEKEEIQIYNSIGQLVNEISVSNNSKIDVSDLSNGIYFIKSKNYQTIKFIKK